jgi:ribosomal protein L29
MATLKFKDMKKMNKEELEKKMKELKLELIKSKVSASKSGSSKIKEIKKIIARILTLNNQGNKIPEGVGNKK